MIKRLCLLCVAVVALAACQSGSRRQANSADRPLITVTIEPLRYFTEAIAGDRFSVVSLVPKGSSPETYDPTPRQLVDLSASCAYLRAGYIGFEQTWAERLAENAPRLKFFDLSAGINLIYDTSHAAAHASPEPGNYAEEESHAVGVEPHVWASAVNARIMVRNIRDALTTLDPDHGPLYAARCDSLCAVLTQTDSTMRAMLASPEADRVFLIYHPALSYFARDYGLRQIAIEAGGKEPSPAHLKDLVDLCRKEHVRVIFVQPEFDRRNAELIAAQTGAHMVTLNPLAYDWRQEMLRAARTLCGRYEVPQAEHFR